MSAWKRSFISPCIKYRQNRQTKEEFSRNSFSEYELFLMNFYSAQAAAINSHAYSVDWKENATEFVFVECQR
jgi:hypothetical protein